MAEYRIFKPGQESEVDHIVDTTGISYDEAMDRVGVEVSDTPSASNPDFRTPSDHKPATLRATRGVQYGDGVAVETPDGRPYYDRPYEELSPEQLEINRRGVALVREALRRARGGEES